MQVKTVEQIEKEFKESIDKYKITYNEIEFTKQDVPPGLYKKVLEAFDLEYIDKEIALGKTPSDADLELLDKTLKSVNVARVNAVVNGVNISSITASWKAPLEPVEMYVCDQKFKECQRLGLKDYPGCKFTAAGFNGDKVYSTFTYHNIANMAGEPKDVRVVGEMLYDSCSRGIHLDGIDYSLYEEAIITNFINTINRYLSIVTVY